MKRIFFYALLFTGVNAVAQQQVNNMTFDTKASGAGYSISKDEETGSQIFNGNITFADLQKEKTFDWLPQGITDYKPNPGQTAYLKTHLPQYEMVVFMGTWCDDSHDLIPKLYKVLETCAYAGNYTMYGVDRAKTVKDGVDKKYNITLVPTIILVKNGKEAGRITETVNNSIESDLADIIRKDTGEQSK